MTKLPEENSNIPQEPPATPAAQSFGPDLAD